MRILLVEDERKVASFIARALRENSYAVDIAESGEKALELTTDVTYDAILLDVRLPGLSGIQVCREMRQQGMEAPVLMLTARGLVEQRVEGLDAGADDYLTKPFGVNELLARLRVALRHAQAGASAPSPIVEVGGLRVDLERREVSVDGREVRLTPIEFRLLALLARNPGRVLTHRQILNEVWGPSYTGQTHYVRVHMAELRKKIEADPARPRLVVTELGVGYRLRDRPGGEP
jgi:two-component system, OmpR family, KDP operon response regulator KdpE